MLFKPRRGILLLVSSISLIEIKWIIISKTKKNPSLREMLREEYNLFLNYLLYSDEIDLTPLLDEENKLLDIDIKDYDYFNRLIFSTALYYADALLAEDEEIWKTWEKEKYKGFNKALHLENVKAVHTIKLGTIFE